MTNNKELNPANEKLLDEENLEQVSGGEKQLTEAELIEVMKQMKEWTPDKDELYPSLDDLINR